MQCNANADAKLLTNKYIQPCGATEAVAALVGKVQICMHDVVWLSILGSPPGCQELTGHDITLARPFGRYLDLRRVLVGQEITWK